MSKHNVPETFDWVRTREKCNVRELFKSLRETVEKDYNIAKGLREWNLQFDPISKDKFAVVRLHDSGIGTMDSVVFKVDGTEIKVAKPIQLKNKTVENILFTAQVILLDSGVCMFEVDEKPLYPWQVSRLALEDMLFKEVHLSAELRRLMSEQTG